MIPNETMPEKMISAQMLGESEAGKAAHLLTSGGVPMGNLTAGMLGDPVQWQILKMIGVYSREPEEYALRLFERGNHVEDWFVNKIQPVQTQLDVEYLGARGRLDCLVDTNTWDNPVGVIPLEVKSVKNSQWPYIVGSKRRKDYDPGPRINHMLQACMYAQALPSDYFAITYIAADDYRTATFVVKKDYVIKGQTDTISEMVDKSIKTAQLYLEHNTVPVFEPKEAWQANPKYCKYPSYQFLTEEQILNKILQEHPDAYRRLMGTVTRDELMREKAGEK